MLIRRQLNKMADQLITQQQHQDLIPGVIIKAPVLTDKCDKINIGHLKDIFILPSL